MASSHIRARRGALPCRTDDTATAVSCCTPHPYVAIDLNYMGRALSALGRAGEALPLHQRALRIDETAHGPDHPFTRQSRQYIELLKPSL